MIATIALTVAAGFGLTAPAHASTPAGCSSVTQIGSTGYIASGSTTFASVKQFKGCGKNYAYIWVWDSYLATGEVEVTCAGIVKSGATNAVDAVCGSQKQQEVWSSGASTLTSCTYARGWLVGDTETDAAGKTDTRC
jgi:hypothetical protein